MKKFIFGLISVMFVSAMAFSLSSCSKEDVEPGKDEDEVTIIGTWRNSEYNRITLKEDGTLIWHDTNGTKDETTYHTYSYENGYINWYWMGGDLEFIWYVFKLYESTMVTYNVDEETGTHGSRQIIWTRVE